MFATRDISLNFYYENRREEKKKDTKSLLGFRNPKKQGKKIQKY